MITYKKATPYIIKGRPVKVYEFPTTVSNIVNAIPPETTVVAVGEENNFIQLYNNGGFVSKNSNVVLDRQTISKLIIEEKIEKNRKRKMSTTSLSMASSVLQGKIFTIDAGVTIDSHGNTIPSDLRGKGTVTYVSDDGTYVVVQAANGNRYSIPSSNLTIQNDANSVEVNASNPEEVTQNKKRTAEEALRTTNNTSNSSSSNTTDTATSTNNTNNSTNNTTTNTENQSALAEWVKKLSGIQSLADLIGVAVGYDHNKDASKFTITNMRAVFGMPYQFHPTADNRQDGSMETAKFGRKYFQKIVNRAPVLVMQAGTPDFLKGFSDESTSKTIKDLLTGNGASSSVMNEAGKYYSFKDSTTEYFEAVNQMCRSVAALMGLSGKTITYNDKTTSPFEINWMNESSGSGGPHNYFGYYRQAVAFYANVSPTIQDNFSNGSRQSQLAGRVNQLSDQAAELQFVLGGLEGNDPTGLAKTLHRDAGEVSSTAGGGGVLGTLIDRIDALMSGGRLIFPEIWSDSSFTKNYNITIKLDSPDCDPLSIYMNIFVPLCHILGFCMPRYAAPNAYVSPFIVRAYLRSMFHIDMGIITSCDIVRGTQQGWTNDGLPTEVTVNLTIKDLYQVLSMIVSKEDIIGNPAQLDYLGNMCGVNVAVPDFSRTITLWAAIKSPTSKLADGTSRVLSNSAKIINNWWQSLFNNFWRIG